MTGGAVGPQGPGSWQASDDRWYPAEQAWGPPPPPGQAPPGAPSSKPPWWKRPVFLVPLALVVGLAVLGALASPDDVGDGEEVAAVGDDTTTSSTSTTEAAETTTTEEAATTTTEPPTTTTTVPDLAPVGTPQEVGDWTVTITSYTADATAQVLAANPFNEAPPPGQVYAVVGISAVYNGSDRGVAAFELSVEIVGSDGIVYTTFGGGSFAVPPAPSLTDTLEVVAGGTATGNVVIQLPAAIAAEPGAITVSATLSLLDDDAAEWAKP